MGAPTKAEEQAKRIKVTKAVASVRSALRHGIVAGGGVSFLQADRALDSYSAAGTVERAARAVLQGTLQAPVRQMAENAGAPAERILHRLAESPAGYGYDFVGQRYGDMLEMGIADCAAAASEGISAAFSAVSVALKSGAILI